jgi:peptide deformylase
MELDDLKLVYWPNKILKQVSDEYDFEEPIYGMQPEDLMATMAKRMIEYKGIGLSAIQLGLPTRVMTVGNPMEPETIMCLFNPKVTFESEPSVITEGCLSFPYMYIKVRRSDHIRVRYQDKTGEWFAQQFAGLTAHAVLHEIDHMDGIVFTERASKLNVDRAKKKMKKYKRMEEHHRQRAEA